MTTTPNVPPPDALLDMPLDELARLYDALLASQAEHLAAIKSLSLPYDTEGHRIADALGLLRKRRKAVGVALALRLRDEMPGGELRANGFRYLCQRDRGRPDGVSGVERKPWPAPKETPA